MTQRDRQTSARNPGEPPREGRSRNDAPSADAAAAVKVATLVWEQVFRTAAPDERERLLSLARRQGIVFAHQLPNSRSTSNLERPVHVQVLNGRLEAWTPLRVQPITARDADLDPIQRDAVAKALQTPDLCLIQGLPGTGKHRVAAEIIHQATARGDRVLLLAPRTGVLNALLGTVAIGDTVLPLRCLDRGERLDQLSPSIRRLTFGEQVDSLRQGIQLAQRKALEAEELGARRKRQEALWPHLHELSASREKLRVEQEALLCKIAHVDQVEREAINADANSIAIWRTALHGAFAEELRAARETLVEAEVSIAEVRKRIGSVQKGVEDRKACAAPLRLLVDAKRDGRWWSARWWRAVLSRNLEARLTQFDGEEERDRITLAELERQLQDLGREQERLQNALRQDHSRLVGTEISRQRAEIEREKAALDLARNALDAQWQETCGKFGEESIVSDLITPDAVQSAYQAWQVRIGHEESQGEFLRAWADALGHAAGQMDRRLLDSVNLVAATVGGLPVDEYLGDATRPQRAFDLLILMEAHEVTEAEFAKIGGRANRSILIGEPADHPPPEKVAARKTNSAKSGIRSSFFHRLWNALHCDPRRLPYAWFHEGDRLGCRLRRIAPEQRRWVESERLADCPEIELRILTLSGKPSELVEVVFPPGQPIHRAKEYIFKELEELPISTLGRGMRWDEQPEQVVLHLADESLTHSQPIFLEPGLRERIGKQSPSEGNGEALKVQGWQTYCLEFERAAGWERRRAEEWVERRLGLADLGRTAWLSKPYRMHSDLALFLSHLLYDGQYCVSNNGQQNGTLAEPAAHTSLLGPAVEFIAVTTDPGVVPTKLHCHEGSRVHQSSGRSASSTAAPATRVGLELDLEDSEQREALREDLRAVLPRSGYVNLAEAQAVANALETLVNDPEFRASARRSGLEGRRAAIGVVALYPAQVELIRRLIEQIPTLLVSEAEIVVESPEAIRDRQCLITLVSLTRSHGHRASSLGDGPHRLVWALTRSTRKLLIFGDPATLQRRCQWEGPVGTLDSVASHRERAILLNLVQYLEGNGTHPRAFHVREGSWA